MEFFRIFAPVMKTLLEILGILNISLLVYIIVKIVLNSSSEQDDIEHNTDTE